MMVNRIAVIAICKLKTIEDRVGGQLIIRVRLRGTFLLEGGKKQKRGRHEGEEGRDKKNGNLKHKNN